MQRRLAAALLAVVLILVVLPVGVAAGGGPPFPDLTGHWSELVVRHALESGWVNGYPDGTFRPEATLSRAEFTKLVVAALGYPPRPVGPVRYIDTASHWVQTQGWLTAAGEVGLFACYLRSETGEADSSRSCLLDRWDKRSGTPVGQTEP